MVQEGEALLVGTGIDISERKKAEEQAKGAFEQMKKRTQELETFNKLAVGRELRMVELKKQIEKLKGK